MWSADCICCSPDTVQQASPWYVLAGTPSRTCNIVYVELDQKIFIVIFLNLFKKMTMTFKKRFVTMKSLHIFFSIFDDLEIRWFFHIRFFIEGHYFEPIQKSSRWAWIQFLKKTNGSYQICTFLCFWKIDRPLILLSHN